MRLIVTGRYRNGDVDYVPGLVLDVKDEEGELLLRDSPGSFVVESEVAGEVPAVDRVAKGGRARMAKGGRAR